MNIQVVVIQITKKCPYNCPQCYMLKGNIDLPIEDAKTLIDSSLLLGAKAIQITGGEPTGYPNLCELIEYAHSRGLYVFLATSGYKHSIEYYCDLKDRGLDIICVSINDIDEDVNKLSRDTYVESLVAIREAVEVGLLCCANVVVSDQNIQNLEVLASYLKRLGVERVDVLRPIHSFDRKYVPSLSLQTVQKLVDIVNQDPDFFRVENCFKEYWEYTTQQVFVCQDVGNTSLFVNADGTISPCSKMQRYRYNSIDEMMKAKNEWKGGCCK